MSLEGPRPPTTAKGVTGKLGTPKPRRACLIVKDCVYHQPVEGQPTLISSEPYRRELTTDEQVWRRKMKLGSDWKPIEKGWIIECGLMVLHNLGKHTIELGISEPHRADFLILPGEDFRGMPRNLEDVYLRSECKESLVLVTLIPK